jgi:ATP-dependent helicase HrpB
MFRCAAAGSACYRPKYQGRRHAIPKGLQITPIGRKMLAFPLHPRYSRMLLAAQEHGCVHQACLVAALTQGRDLLLRNVGREVVSAREDLFGDKASSDFWILMRAWTYAAKNQFRLEACRKLGIHAVTARQVGPLFEQFLRIAKARASTRRRAKSRTRRCRNAFSSGSATGWRAGWMQGTLRCELVHNRRGVLARESVVQHSPLFVAAEIREVETRDREVNTILSLATAIEVDWLRELFPEDMASDVHVEFDSTRSGCRPPSWCVFAGWRCRPNALTRRPPKRRRGCWPMKFWPAGCRCRTGTTALSNGWRGCICFASTVPSFNCRPHRR